ncbi:predicted protein [Sclerotinia sclerotiorum 1980 UF-70]|uniref:Uncharacterized protein n=1 Tax=Sclerotinia sclerotiorum (strain ATCC 18683 / 1980 / Ss-1) TaxID=665079 RepID=A7F4R5_SCLS1|nr:predicted protein [Sclerotinia sclerotiorum 1980 UF-70]EDN97736.1 predicted protein [Sclerotinia sclerotiorum 1980 UF-70]
MMGNSYRGVPGKPDVSVRRRERDGRECLGTTEGEYGILEMTQYFLAIQLVEYITDLDECNNPKIISSETSHSSTHPFTNPNPSTPQLLNPNTQYPNPLKHRKMPSSTTPTFVHSETIHIGNWLIQRGEAIFMFIVGMFLGLFFFLFTFRVFDEFIRPVYFAGLPGLRDRNVDVDVGLGLGLDRMGGRGGMDGNLRGGRGGSDAVPVPVDRFRGVV